MTDARILGHMVVRNELDRYLDHTVRWLQQITDEMHVHDDRSTDGTFERLGDLKVTATRRSPDEPSFMDHEARFRGAAWQAMRERLAPAVGDWILCMDADELLLGDYPGDARQALQDEIAAAEEDDTDAIAFEVAEAFRFEGDIPMLRVDGYWGSIMACRLVRWRQRPEGLFALTQLGGGSVPSNWRAPDGTSPNLTILHLGYVRAEDRVAKYERYKAASGHNPRHIESILGQPLLAPWAGQKLPAEMTHADTR